MEDRLNIRIETDLVNRIKIHAQKLGISISAFVRMAVIEKLDRDNPDKVDYIFMEQIKKEHLNG